MTGSSLDARYFDGIFASDQDPWNLASSAYEAAKFDATIAALDDKRYANGLEVGCAHGVLTERVSAVCDRLLAIDISTEALAQATKRLGNRPGVVLRQMVFPKTVPQETGFDLVLLSEVVYYWGSEDLKQAADWLLTAVVPGGRVMLVHWLGETDYPQTGDGAVEAIWAGVADHFRVERENRSDQYRLDMWARR